MNSVFKEACSIPGFHVPAYHLSFAGITRAKNSRSAPAEIAGQRVLLTAQKAAEGGGWSSPPDSMPVLKTKLTCVLSSFWLPGSCGW